MYWSYLNINDVDTREIDAVYAHLSPTRKAHIDRLKKAADRTRSLAAEWLVQQLLREHYGICDAVLHRHSSGQPYLSDCGLHVSISHSDQIVACVVSRQPVGIDIEKMRPVSPAMCRRVCTAEEAAYLLDGAADFPPQEEQDPAFLRRFFEIWTAKEAYFKKCGTGITNLAAVNTLALQKQTHQIGEYVLQII